MKQHPKVLIISNDCISNVTSNGRTLRNFLLGYPCENLAQFCIHDTAPDYTVCKNYYRVSDRDALNAFLKGRAASGKMAVNTPKTAQGSNVQTGRTPITMLIRNIVWNSMRWAGTSFANWVNAFSPELILLQAGDCSFMYDLARKLAAKYQIPLVIYNSEAYYFKKFDYLCSSGIAKLFYPVFHGQLRRSFQKCIRLAKKSIYICDKLKEDYDAEFGLPSETIYTATQLSCKKEENNNSDVQITYLGNLGIGRHEALIEIGQALQYISPELKLQVYGKASDSEILEALENCPGIDFKGFVPYEQVVEIMQKSDILIHAENFSAFYQEDLKYAFSTKIADSLACGRCFLLYAPDNMACSEYLKANQAAYVVNNKEALVPVLKELCANPSSRKLYVLNALRLARENHNEAKNATRFQEILCESGKRKL